jgi:hypothetical protein
MSNLYWNKDLGPWIAAGAIVFLAFDLGVLGIGISQVYESVQHEQNTTKAHKNAKDIFDRECTKFTSVQDLRDCAEKTVKTSRETDRSEEDLYAQKQMAQWAYWLLLFTSFIGIVSIAITGVGTYLLLRTVMLSGQANTINRDIGIAQVRAYLTCTGGKYVISGSGVTCYYSIKNTGQSPAMKVSIEGTLTFLGGNFGAIPKEVIDLLQSYMVMGNENIAIGSCETISAGAAAESNIFWPNYNFIQEQFEKIRMAGEQFDIRVRITWFDVFKRQQILPVILQKVNGSDMFIEGAGVRSGNMKAYNQDLHQ